MLADQSLAGLKRRQFDKLSNTILFDGDLREFKFLPLHSNVELVSSDWKLVDLN